MLTFLLGMTLGGCVRHLSWDVLPAPAVALAPGAVSVAAARRDCADLADMLLDVLASRPGLHIDPAAPARLTVTDCRQEVRATVEVDARSPGVDYGSAAEVQRRRLVLQGDGSAQVLYTGPGGLKVDLSGQGHSVRATPWSVDGPNPVPRASRMRGELWREVALSVADQLAPLPARIRRTLYRDPEPGSARALHNAAVQAERDGQLDRAMKLAREAYAADPTAAALRTMQRIQDHAHTVGYALLPEPDSAGGDARAPAAE